MPLIAHLSCCVNEVDTEVFVLQLQVMVVGEFWEKKTPSQDWRPRKRHDLNESQQAKCHGYIVVS